MKKREEKCVSKKSRFPHLFWRYFPTVKICIESFKIVLETSECCVIVSDYPNLLLFRVIMPPRRRTAASALAAIAAIVASEPVGEADVEDEVLKEAARAPAGGGHEKIVLQCVQQGSKLRIRFYSYTNAAGKNFTNVYNNSYNCQFPRAIRAAGCYYEIGSQDLQLVAGGGKTPFYRVATNAIRVMPRRYRPGATEVDVSAPHPASTSSKKTPTTVRDVEVAVAARPEQIYEVNECVVCLCDKPDVIFIPCAHLCACSGCYTDVAKTARPQCPLCRRTITQTIANNA